MNTAREPPDGDRLENHRYFGDFENLAKLGGGGMGLVLKVRHMELDRILALKLIRPDFLDSPEAVERFQAEARAAARLDHPNIVPIHDSGEIEGRHFFTMKFVEGGNLADEGARQRFQGNPRAVAAFMAKVARAVDYMHREFILHRDLKPSNILVDAQGEPVVTDFGIAKLLDRSSGLTGTGAQPGTRYYMAPERLVGKRAVSFGADVWSLGVILYELLTGCRPFEGETDSETEQKVLHEEPPPLPLPRSKANRWLKDICRKCLCKAPQYRYGSAEELAEDLERWLRGEPPKGPVPAWLRAWLWARRNPYRAATLMLASLLPLIGFLVAGYYLLRMAALSSEEGPVYPIGSTNYINSSIFVWQLPLYGSSFGGRCTENVWSKSFRNQGHPRGQIRFLNIENVPASIATSLKCQLKADYHGWPDRRLSGTLTNGQIFTVPPLGKQAWNYYFAPVGWNPDELKKLAPEALIEFRLLPAP